MTKETASDMFDMVSNISATSFLYRKERWERWSYITNSGILACLTQNHTQNNQNDGEMSILHGLVTLTNDDVKKFGEDSEDN